MTRFPFHALVVLLALLLLAGQAKGDSAELEERHPEDELLLDLWLKKDLRISDEFVGYPSHNGGTLVPLGLLCSLTGIAIEVNPTEGTAEGFILQESERFHLDVTSGKATVSGVDSRFSTSLVERHYDDIYVESSLLREWLPLELHIDLLNSSAHLYPQKPLPMQERWAREERFKRLEIQRQAREGASYPEHPNDYQAWSGPFIDESLDVRLARKKDGETTKTLRHATMATMDLAYWNSRFFVSGNEDEVFEDKRLTFSRANPEGGLLGPLDARQAKFGDINAEGMTLIHNGSAATGVTIGNYPLETQGQFSTQDFFGDALPGWEVELYRNDVLLDYQVVGEDGRYRFDAVPLLYGMNVFRIVVYGPQGQKRSEIKRFNIARPLVQPGEHQYRLTVAQTEDGLERLSAEYRTGIGRNVTFDTGLSVWHLDGPSGTPETRDWKTQALFGVQSFYESWFGSLHVAMDVNGTVAAQAGVQGRYGDLDFSFQHQEIGSFQSERHTFDATAIKRSDKVKLNGYFRPGRIFSSVSYSLSGLREVRVDDSVLTEIGNRISVFHPRLSVANELTFSRLDRSTGESTRADGALRLRAPMNGWNTGGEMTYELKPEASVKKLGMTVDRRLGNGYIVGLGVNHHVLEDTSDMSLSLSKTFGSFTLSSTLFASESGELSAGLNLTTATGRDNRGRWTPSAKPIAGSGGASVTAFLDQNRNGVRDDGEEDVEDIGLRVNGTTPRVATRGDDQTTIYGLAPNRWNTISLVSGDIDPAWVPSKPGVRLLARPGTTPQVDFPLVIVGEIDGTISLLTNGKARGVGGVRVELVDNDGSVVREERTAYDGFYLFEQVSPGRYRVRAAPAQLDELKLLPDSGQVVEVGDDGPIISGIDMTLRRAGDDHAIDDSPTTTLPAVAPNPTEPSIEFSTWVVQIGSFSSRENAERLITKLREQGVKMRPPEIIEINGKTMYRVLAGPAASRDQAEAMLNRLRQAGGPARLLVRTVLTPGS